MDDLLKAQETILKGGEIFYQKFNHISRENIQIGLKPLISDIVYSHEICRVLQNMIHGN